jgi:hypothetical protein
MRKGETRFLHFEGTEETAAFTYLGKDETGHEVLRCVYPLDDGFSIEFVGRGTYQEPSKETPKNVGWASLVYDGTELLMLWETATMQQDDNPVELRYSYENGTACLWLAGLELGSMAQARAMLGKLREFEKLLRFKQAQRGGRPKGKRPAAVTWRYEHILKMRNSLSYRHQTDDKFIRIYNAKLHQGEKPITQGELSRAVRWEREGKPK